MIYNKTTLQNILENDLARIEEALRLLRLGQSPEERERLKNLAELRTNGINELKRKYGK